MVGVQEDPYTQAGFQDFSAPNNTQIIIWCFSLVSSSLLKPRVRPEIRLNMFIIFFLFLVVEKF
jgi:hypothetical protein